MWLCLEAEKRRQHSRMQDLVMAGMFMLLGAKAEPHQKVLAVLMTVVK
jgi:hypothetical protein